MKKKSSKFGADWDKIGSNIYSGTASFGKDYTYIMTIITLIVCLIMLVTGIIFLFKKSVYTKQATFTITSDDGAPGMNGTTTYKGTVTGCSGSTTLTTLVLHTKGDNVNVYQNPANPCDIVEKPVPYKVISGILISLSVIIGTFSLINMFFVKKYKGVAAVEGAAGVFNLFRRG